MSNNYKTAIYLLSHIVLLLFSCGKDVSGTGSQAGNSVVVVGSALYVDSTAAAEVEIYVRSANFLPSMDSAINEESEATTGSEGELTLSLPRDSVMVLELVDNQGYAHIAYCTTSVDQDTIDLGMLELEEEAEFKGVVDRTTIDDSEAIYVQVYGMNKVVPVEKDGSFRMRRMPPGEFTYRIIPGGDKDPYFDHEPLALAPKDTLDVGTFDPTQDISKDTLIIRSVLDLNGHSEIPVSSVIKKDSKGYIVELDLRSRDIDTLIPEIGKLRIRRLLLANNKLTKMPVEVQNMSALQELDLSGNLFVVIPIGVYDMRNLKVLTINNCKLIEFHRNIGRMRYLKELYAHGNEIAQIPPDMGKLQELRRLDLSSNKISTLPYQITHLAKVEFLNMNNNSLTYVEPAIDSWITQKSGDDSWKDTQL